MSDKPKPLTKAEWEEWKLCTTTTEGFEDEGAQLIATLDALFRYRERTRGMEPHCWEVGIDDADNIAAEEGIE